MRPAVVIVGAQWGDEGKGKVVDLLSEQFDVVARYAGGPNAGHTLIVGEDKLVFRLVPSGVLHEHTRCVLGQGMVINAGALLEEVDALLARGLSIDGRLWLSDRAHLILPYHIALDELRERALGAAKIGTTKRGIGPCYEDKVGRRGIRTGDLQNLREAREKIAQTLHAWAPTFAALDGESPALDVVMAGLEAAAPRLVPLLRDTSSYLEQAMRADQRVMLEGAQGTLLDLDHGSYPFVTSSSAVAGGACTGCGVGPSRVGCVLGISKAYATRVGSGPFPTELDDAAGEHLRRVGKEFGSVTGRPRRAGWLDLAALRYARTVNGLDMLAITKLDVLTGLPSIRTGVAYEAAAGPAEDGGAGITEAAMPRDLSGVRVRYAEHPGWTEDISGCRTLAALPGAARALLDHIEEQTELPVALVSVGPRRDQTIRVRDVG